VEIGHFVRTGQRSWGDEMSCCVPW